MATDTNRVFTDKELLDAGRLTTDLIAEHLECGLRPEAGKLVRRFQKELKERH